MSSPIHIILILSCCVFFNQSSYSFFTLVELIIRILEDPSLFVMMKLCASLPELLVLLQDNFEQVSDTGMVSQHHSVNFVGSLYVRTLFG